MIKAAVFLLLVIWRWPIIYEQVTIDLVADARLIANFCGSDRQMSTACLLETQQYPVWFVTAGKLTVEAGVLVFVWLMFIY